MSGHQPSDADDVFTDAAGQLDAEAGTRLSEVTAYLASVPAPVLPENLEARIMAAITAEATRRAGTTGAEPAAQAPNGTPAQDGRPAPDAGGTLRPAPNRARVRRGRRPQRRAGARPGGAPRRDRSRLYLKVAGSVAVCLVFAGLGWAISLGHPADSASGPAEAGPAAGASSTSRPVAPAAAGVFTVTESGTRYRQATLAAQVRARVVSSGISVPGTGHTPDSASSSAASSSAASSSSLSSGSVSSTGQRPPSAALAGCVLHFTGGTPPRLVDRASYQGTAAYIIASSSRVWVVGLGCTAAKPELIVSVPLAG